MSKEIIALSLQGIRARLRSQGSREATIYGIGKIKWGPAFRMRKLSEVVRDGERGGRYQIMSRRPGVWTRIAWATARACRMTYREVWGVDPPEEYGEPGFLPYRSRPQDPDQDEED